MKTADEMRKITEAEDKRRGLEREVIIEGHMKSIMERIDEAGSNGKYECRFAILCQNLSIQDLIQERLKKLGYIVTSDTISWYPFDQNDLWSHRCSN